MNQRLQSHFEERKRIRDAFASIEIPLSQYRVLDILCNSRRMRISDLSLSSHISKPNLNPTVDHLERLGFVRRMPDFHDRRVVFVQITEKGRKAYEEANAIVSKLLPITQP